MKFLRNLFKRKTKLVVNNKRKMGRPCKPVDNVVANKKAQKICKEIVSVAKDLAAKHPMGCCGLAANQIGYNYRIITILCGRTWKVYINPNFAVDESPSNRTVTRKEGCLSFPTKAYNVSRYRKIWVYSDNHKPALLTGREAEAFQHEMDHINGVIPYA